MHSVSRVWWSTLSDFAEINKDTDHGSGGGEGELPLVYQLDQCVYSGCSLFIDPYCLGSTWSLAMSRIQVQMNFSRHFDKTGVREIGRKSSKMMTISAHAQHLCVEEGVGRL